MASPERFASTTAVVVDWNLPKLTQRCVEALIADGLPAERIVVVENGSTSENVDEVRSALPNCELLVIEENVGYARAANRGARHQDSQTYLFVNNDAFAEGADAVAKLQTALERPGVGLAVPRLLNEDGTLQRNVVPLPTPLVALCLATGASRIVPNRVRPFWSNWWDHSDSRTVAASRAAVIAVRGDLWRTLGGWAERDWMFGEDIDISWRAAKAGWSTWFERDSVFVHLGNSTGFVDGERMRLASTATRRVIEDELPPLKATMSLAALSAGHAARAVAFRVVGDRRSASCARIAAKAYLPLVDPR